MGAFQWGFTPFLSAPVFSKGRSMKTTPAPPSLSGLLLNNNTSLPAVVSSSTEASATKSFTPERRLAASSNLQRQPAATIGSPVHYAAMPDSRSTQVVPPPQRIAFLGNYSPRLCGIATFTHDLCEAVAAAAPAADCLVGAVTDRPQGYDYPPRVRIELQEKVLQSYRNAADYLNVTHADMLCVQHEFGIYGGAAGSHLLELLREVHMPVVTTLHTLLQHPTPDQRQVMDELIRLSTRLVVMTRKGAQILRETYGVSATKIDIIPHGIPDMPLASSHRFKAQFQVEGRQVLLTFGLIGPGKGIEQVIDALPQILRQHPDALYMIVGATHPNLLAHEGERYRLSLQRQARDLGVEDQVRFCNRFVTLDELKQFIGATDIYLTPYLQEAQVTSGTLAYVFGAGKAVVSTPYWHARELLAEGRGVLVPFGDPQAIAKAVSELLDNPVRMEAMQREAHALGREMTWSATAQRYLQSFKTACAARLAPPEAVFNGWKPGKTTRDWEAVASY